MSRVATEAELKEEEAYGFSGAYAPPVSGTDEKHPGGIPSASEIRELEQKEEEIYGQGAYAPREQVPSVLSVPQVSGERTTVTGRVEKLTTEEKEAYFTIIGQVPPDEKFIPDATGVEYEITGTKEEASKLSDWYKSLPAAAAALGKKEKSEIDR